MSGARLWAQAYVALLETAVTTALPGPQVLSATAVRTAFLLKAGPWKPPPPVDASPVRKRALVEGPGFPLCVTSSCRLLSRVSVAARGSGCGDGW